MTDHGFVKSIYFFDPNGIRLEFTAPMAGEDKLADYARRAHRELEAWTREKAERQRVARRKLSG